MSTPDTDRQAPFQDAFDDLGRRLTSGLGHLSALASSCSTEGDQVRLRAKIGGLDRAQHVWNSQSVMSRESGDYAAGWRIFTAIIGADLTAPHATTSPGYAEGLHLALSYQRGYSPDIDAPRFLQTP